MTFTATGGTFNHMSADLAGDPKVTTSGSTITWGEHMSDAANAGSDVSAVPGAGLGPSTRGTPTAGGGGITDQGFWADKAEATWRFPRELSSVFLRLKPNQTRSSCPRPSRVVPRRA